MTFPSAVFLIHLLQDVQVLRPLIFMAARDFGFRTQLLVSDRFRARDTSGLWLNEIGSLSEQTGAILHFFADDWQARSHLQGQGLLFAASESHIRNHSVAHDIFRHAPSTFLKVTVQHGFECVGFRHGADHVRSYGATASFAADILCAWSSREHLTALASSQAPKLVVTGPTSVLQMPVGQVGQVGSGPRPGLVCENLHSVRFDSADKLEREFIATFRNFAVAMNRKGRSVRLRPHPGGQYLAKANAVLPGIVELENAPLYRLDLRQFSYGVSPPSSVLIDMLIAGIPTAVWRDRRGQIDVSNYDGLVTVSSEDELIDFAQDASARTEEHLHRQRQWLARQGMPLEPADVYARFAELFKSAERMEVRRPGSRAERERVLVIGRPSPGLQKALQLLTASGEFVVRTMPGSTSETQDGEQGSLEGDGVLNLLEAVGASVLLMCEQDLGAYRPVLLWAKAQKVPVICCFSSRTEGESTDGPFGMDGDVRGTSELFDCVDVIYAPTEEQKARLEQRFPTLRTILGPAEQQVLREQQSDALSREELLRIIAAGHASLRSRADKSQEEVRVCHSR